MRFFVGKRTRMNYQEYQKLFSGTQAGINREIKSEKGTLTLQWFNFDSPGAEEAAKIEPSLMQEVPQLTDRDKLITENQTFCFPVLSPAWSPDQKKAIILLHGLNERSWNKYWSWAAVLAENLERPVILFPISFHINRAPATWGDPRAINALMKTDTTPIVRDDSTSFANFILSKRLIDDPLRFLTSGFQSAIDLYRLIRLLKNNSIKGIGSMNQIDIFAYSIGGFLSQILLINNYIISESTGRTAIFCGGSPFVNMNGISKMIMNKPAFHTIFKYYLEETVREMKNGSPLGLFLKKHPLGQAFNAMISPDRNPGLLKSALSAAKEKVRVWTLKHDTVIPSLPTISLFRGLPGVVTEHDFPFAYSHENPFPVYAEEGKAQQVNAAFHEIFTRAVGFLNS